MLKEEFDQRGITMETLQDVFPLHQAHPPPAAPAPAQVPLSPPVPSTPQMHDSLVSSGLGRAQVVVNLPHSLEAVAISSDDNPIEKYEDHLPAEDDSEEDKEIDDVVRE